MDSSANVVELLTEIRDLQREHLEEYRHVAGRLMELQEHAVRVQAAAVARQRTAMLVLVGMLVLLGSYFLLALRH